MNAKQLTSEDSTLVYSYFLHHVAEDMKSTMIASVRQKTGYEDSFFFNNDPESMNNRIKTRMEKKKLSWPECVQQLKEMAEEQERNVNRALIDEGPYRIRPECRRLIIPVEKWLAMSKDQKEKKLKEFQKIPLSKAFAVSASATVSSIPSLLEAATEGMPSSSGKKPGQSGRRGRRRSLSSPRDTTGFRPRITVTEEHSSGARDTNEFQPRQTASELQSAVPTGASGFQPTVTDNDLQSAVPTDTCGFQRKVTAHEAQTSERQYTCTWIKDTKAYMCYGCDYPLRPKPTGQPRDVLPPAPFDVVLCRKELRMYKTKAGALTYSVQPQNVYYHLKKTCVLKKNKQFTTEDLFVNLAGLEAAHIDQLRKEFGLTI